MSYNKVTLVREMKSTENGIVFIAHLKEGRVGVKDGISPTLAEFTTCLSFYFI
jgi:hypothetical protein